MRGTWRIDHSGDAVVSWACPDHLSSVCEWLQRDWEITELKVTNAAKTAEWRHVASTLDDIAESGL